MEYDISKQGQFTIVQLKGDVDLYYSPKARQAILDNLNKKQNVLVDLSQVTYIDSSGVASLVEGYQLAKDYNLDFGLIGVSEAAINVLQLARLDQVFPIYGSLDERLKHGG